MTMAPLSAALITRQGGPRQVGQMPTQFQPRQLARPAPRPIVRPAATATPVAAKNVVKVAAKKRIQKTLRLDPTLDQGLIALALAAGVSQQSMMERAVQDLVAHGAKPDDRTRTIACHPANDRIAPKGNR